MLHAIGTAAPIRMQVIADLLQLALHDAWRGGLVERKIDHIGQLKVGVDLDRLFVEHGALARKRVDPVRLRLRLPLQAHVFVLDLDAAHDSLQGEDGAAIVAGRIEQLLEGRGGARWVSGSGRGVSRRGE